jgi:hypothetical protein
VWARRVSRVLREEVLTAKSAKIAKGAKEEKDQIVE